MTDATKRSRKRLLRSPDEVPGFASEEEAAEFWDSADFGEEFWAYGSPLTPEELALLPPPRPPKDPVSVRFGDDVLLRLQALAQKRGVRYLTLIRQFVTERLEEEERRESTQQPPALHESAHSGSSVCATAHSTKASRARSG